jgi:hypothetical protein
MTARRETDLSWKLGLRGYAVFPTHLHDIRGSQHTVYLAVIPGLPA